MNRHRGRGCLVDAGLVLLDAAPHREGYQRLAEGAEQRAVAVDDRIGRPSRRQRSLNAGQQAGRQGGLAIWRRDDAARCRSLAPAILTAFDQLPKDQSAWRGVGLSVPEPG